MRSRLTVDVPSKDDGAKANGRVEARDKLLAADVLGSQDTINVRGRDLDLVGPVVTSASSSASFSRSVSSKATRTGSTGDRRQREGAHIVFMTSRRAASSSAVRGVGPIVSGTRALLLASLVGVCAEGDDRQTLVDRGGECAREEGSLAGSRTQNDTSEHGGCEGGG